MLEIRQSEVVITENATCEQIVNAIRNIENHRVEIVPLHALAKRKAELEFEGTLNTCWICKQPFSGKAAYSSTSITGAIFNYCAACWNQKAC